MGSGIDAELQVVVLMSVCIFFITIKPFRSVRQLLLINVWVGVDMRDGGTLLSPTVGPPKWLDQALVKKH